MGTCPVLFQRFLVGNHLRPSDVVDIAEESVNESLQLVGVCLCGAPCLRAVKQDRLHVGVEDPDLVMG
jgi:hypothetical protein